MLQQKQQQVVPTTTTTTSSSSSSSSSKNPPGNGRRADGDLFENLVEIFPLVESLMDRRANPSFKRRASMAYTPAPPHRNKVGDTKGKRTTQTLSAIKERDCGDNTSTKHIDNHESIVEDFSMSSSMTLTEDVQKNKEELTSLKEQLDDLRIKVSEKEEALKSTEDTMNQMATVHSTIHELKGKVAEKELLLASVNSQLSNAEIKLVEKQEVLDKLESEARKSNRRVEELQRDLDHMGFEKTALMLLFQELSKNDSAEYSEDNITCFQEFDHVPLIDDLTEIKMEKMEAARVAYVAAVARAKENPSHELMAAAADARLKLKAYAF